MRAMFAREDALSFEGKEYQIPYRGPGATGLGKPLKSILHCEQPMPIYAATPDARRREAAPRWRRLLPGVDGPRAFDVFREPIEKGFKAAGGGKTSTIRRRAVRDAIMGDDVEAVHAPMPRQGHGALHRRHGRQATRTSTTTTRRGSATAMRRARSRICTLPGRRTRRWPLCPTQLVDACALVGPAARIRDRAQRWIEAGKKGHVGSMLIGTGQKPKALELMAELVL